jgi:hypothetical protein
MIAAAIAFKNDEGAAHTKRAKAVPGQVRPMTAKQSPRYAGGFDRQRGGWGCGARKCYENARHGPAVSPELDFFQPAARRRAGSRLRRRHRTFNDLPSPAPPGFIHPCAPSLATIYLCVNLIAQATLVPRRLRACFRNTGLDVQGFSSLGHSEQ